jgi:hypothetical protein
LAIKYDEAQTCPLLWDYVVFVVELELSKVLEGCSRAPNNTLRPRARLKGLIRRCREVVHSRHFDLSVLRRRIRDIWFAEGFVFGFEYYLVLPIGE